MVYVNSVVSLTVTKLTTANVSVVGPYNVCLELCAGWG